LTATADLAKILASVNAPASVTQSDTLSPLQQMTTLLSGVNTGVSGANSLLGTLFPKSGTGGTPLSLSGLFSGLGSLFTGDKTVYALADGSTTTDKNTYLADLQQQAADELAGLQNNSGGSNG